MPRSGHNVSNMNKGIKFQELQGFFKKNLGEPLTLNPTLAPSMHPGEWSLHKTV